MLDFDIENRPLSYWYDGNPTAEITAIAWGWHDEDEVHCGMVNGKTESAFFDSMEDMLVRFCTAYDQADMVTGHYIRKHDLPIINGALMEMKMAPLRSKLTHDTKLDLLRISGLPASQEALGCMYNLEADKHHMNAFTWRSPNRMFNVSESHDRVTSDVVQHKELYKALQEARYLKAPKYWRP